MQASHSIKKGACKALAGGLILKTPRILSSRCWPRMKLQSSYHPQQAANCTSVKRDSLAALLLSRNSLLPWRMYASADGTFAIQPYDRPALEHLSLPSSSALSLSEQLSAGMLHRFVSLASYCENIPKFGFSYQDFPVAKAHAPSVGCHFCTIWPIYGHLRVATMCACLLNKSPTHDVALFN